jgi:hypothetical protein
MGGGIFDLGGGSKAVSLRWLSGFGRKGFQALRSHFLAAFAGFSYTANGPKPESDRRLAKYFSLRLKMYVVLAKFPVASPAFREDAPRPGIAFHVKSCKLA